MQKNEGLLQQSEELIRRIKDKNKTDDEWLELFDEVEDFLKGDLPPEIRRRFEPLGWFEMLCKVCAGIDHRRGTGSHEKERDKM